MSGEGGDACVKTVLAGEGMCVWAACEGVDEDAAVVDDMRGDEVGELLVNISYEPV